MNQKKANTISKGLFQEHKVGFVERSINIIHYINKLRKKSMIMSKDAERNLIKFQHPFLKKKKNLMKNSNGIQENIILMVKH